ncbi:MAG: hypothetical protein COZ18_14695 [Flexibacter sp. CG_4_10_14_3_um_filter_32_15]|nr:MAG: hypothetical protein COZ18_14695 [Flexibacter sp. CG_4_10_14_3_um_filter_32_15]
MNNLVEDFRLKPFIEGESVDLCIPDENFARNSTWYSWFNDFKVTRFLEQGIFPNTVDKQVEFYKDLDKNNRLSLIISDKKCYVGTVSLSNIDLYKRTADIAILLGETSTSSFSDVVALEAMALLTSHGFLRIGLVSIHAGQHAKLIKWQRKLELLGYRADSFKQGEFKKGNEIADAVSISITKQDFELLLSKRDNRLWDSADKMRARLSNLPKEAFISKLKNFMINEGNSYYEEIYNL